MAVKTKRKSKGEEAFELMHRTRWKIDGHKIIEEGRGIIATCSTPQNGGTFDIQENITLLASAPELLDATERLLAIVTDAIMHGMPITKDVADARNIAVAAKSRAKAK